MEMEEEIIDPAVAEQQQPPEKKPRIDANDNDSSSSNQQNAVKSIVVNLLDQSMAEEEESDNDNKAPPSARPMKIQLPLETWVDVLAFVPRWQLGEVSSQIHNRQFAKILQFFLHKCGEITLGNMEIFEPRENACRCRPTVIAPPPVLNNWGKSRRRETTLADGPPPKNVKDFASIYLSYLDKSVLNFLKELQQHEDSSLLANVNFSISYLRKEINLLKILANLLPLISRFDSIHLWNHHLKQINDAAGNNNDVCQLAIKMLAQTRWLEICYHFSVLTYEIDWFCNWLYSPRADLEPRVLHIHMQSSNYWGRDMQNIHPLINRIKKDFLMATQPVIFFILIVVRHSFRLEHANLANDKTRERLVVKKTSYGNGMLISRYPLETGNNKWEEAEEEAEYWKFGQQGRRIIRLQRELKMAL